LPRLDAISKVSFALFILLYFAIVGLKLDLVRGFSLWMTLAFLMGGCVVKMLSVGLAGQTSCLARAVAREREIGIRVAIGANRGGIFRQLCTESLLLAVLGALAGLALGSAVTQVVFTQLDAPKWASTAPDWRVLLFTITVMFAAAAALRVTTFAASCIFQKALDSGVDSRVYAPK
jgi:ABC-type lipoprotein release transport system permease subunit